MGKGRSAATLYGESLIMNRDYIQRMTDQMVRGLPLLGETTKATEGAAKAHEHAAKAVKAHAEATRDLAPLLPPVVQAMMDIEKSRADAAIRALAEALLDETEAIKKMGMAIKFSLPFNPSMFKPFVDGFHQLTAAERAALPTQREIAIVLKDLLKTYPDLTQAEAKHRAEMLAANPEIRKIIDSTTSETRARRELTKAIKDQSEAEGQLMNQERALESFTNSFTDSIEKQVAAIRADMAASVQGIAATTAALILGKRAQAAVEGTFDTAKAIESFAKYAESHYTDAAYLEAAIQYGLSAAQMFVVAGERWRQHRFPWRWGWIIRFSFAERRPSSRIVGATGGGCNGHNCANYSWTDISGGIGRRSDYQGCHFERFAVRPARCGCAHELHPAARWPACGLARSQPGEGWPVSDMGKD